MMFQQEYDPYGFSFMETSFSNEIMDYFQNVVVLGSDDSNSHLCDPISSSSSSRRPSCSIQEQQFHSMEKLSSPRVRGGFGEEPPRKRKRKRTRGENNVEEKENQRMNHITVERNRRRQMNHFLSILKSMMPLSYSQHSDQASIIEGTISYLKKLEQLLQLKTIHSSNVFSDFFIFPQYSIASFSNHHHQEQLLPQPVVADVEVTMMETYANIKVLTKTKPRLLFKIVSEFYSLGLSTLHLNLTTSQDMSLLTFSVKVEEYCQMKTTVKEVANAVHEVLRRIHKES